jgi:hypothetical protein
MVDNNSELLHNILKNNIKNYNKIQQRERKLPEEELKKRKLLEESEISLILNNYDDIFSDFDPRPFSQRALSIDFLDEAKRAAKEKIEGMELKFLVPKIKKNTETENTVRKRLYEHFKKHYTLSEDELKRDFRKGMITAIIGIILMTSAAYIRHFLSSGFFWTILTIIFEPAGWFTTWRGLDLIFLPAKEKKQELEFYRKMEKSEISFVYY